MTAKKLVYVSSLVLLLFAVATIPLSFFQKRIGEDFGLLKDKDNLDSFYKNESDYFSSFASSSGIPQTPVVGGITNHHFLAKDYLAHFFAGIDPQSVKRIILVGPDHFQKITDTRALASTTTTEWTTPFGLLSADQSFLQRLFPDSRLHFDTNIFRNEHSIYTLVPFIKYYFPNATLVPFILKQSSDFQSFHQYGQLLSDMVNKKDTLFIVSSDFSHNSTSDEAQKNDQISLQSLSQTDIKNLDSITCDCRQCIAMLYGYLGDSPTSFKKIYNSNSYQISGKPDNITSYIGGYYIANPN